MMYRIRLQRSLIDRMAGGVCGGMGECLNISAWWVRGAFLALALTSFGFAVLLYGLLWVSIPSQRLSDLPPLRRPGEAAPPRYTRPEAILTIGGLAILVGVVILAQTTGVLQSARGGDLLLPIMLLLIGVVILFKQLRGAA